MTASGFAKQITLLMIVAASMGCNSAAAPNATTMGDAVADRDVVEKHLAAAGFTDGDILRVVDRGERWEVAFAAPVSRELHAVKEKQGDVVMKSPVQTLSVKKTDGRVSKVE